jgi:hypothetical protein
MAILDASALMMSRRRANMFQIQTPGGHGGCEDAETIAT